MAVTSSSHLRVYLPRFFPLSRNGIASYWRSLATVAVGGKKVPSPRRYLGKRLGCVLVDLVGAGQPLSVLAQVLVPGCDYEDLLEDAPAPLPRAKQAPLGGASAQM